MEYIETFFYSVTIVSFILAINYFLTNRSLNGMMDKVVSKVRKDHCSNEIEGTSLSKTTTNLNFGTDPATETSFYLSSNEVAGSFPNAIEDKTINYSQQGRSIYQSNSHTPS